MAITIEEYLRGKVGFEVSDSTLTSILIDRAIPEQTDVCDISVKNRELAYADLLMWGATNPTSYSGSKEADGGWSHTEGSKTISVSDKNRWASMANSIYEKYDDNNLKPRIRIFNLPC